MDIDSKTQQKIIQVQHQIGFLEVNEIVKPKDPNESSKTKASFMYQISCPFQSVPAQPNTAMITAGKFYKKSGPSTLVPELCFSFDRKVPQITFTLDNYSVKILNKALQPPDKINKILKIITAMIASNNNMSQWKIDTPNPQSPTMQEFFRYVCTEDWLCKVSKFLYS